MKTLVSVAAGLIVGPMLFLAAAFDFLLIVGWILMGLCSAILHYVPGLLNALVLFVLSVFLTAAIRKAKQLQRRL